MFVNADIVITENLIHVTLNGEVVFSSSQYIECMLWVYEMEEHDSSKYCDTHDDFSDIFNGCNDASVADK